MSKTETEETSKEEGINSDPVEKESVEAPVKPEATSAEEGENIVTGPMFTQEEVNQLLGKVRAEGRTKGNDQAIDDILDKTGVASLDALEEMAADHKRLSLEAMTDKERLEAELADSKLAEERATAREATATQAANEAVIKSAVVGAAAGRFESAEAAYMLLDKDKLSLAEDGSVEGLDEALEVLLKEYPFLKKGGPSSIVSPTNPTQTEPTGRTDDQRRSEYFGRAQTDGFWKGGEVRKITETD
jgi:hypothetical protein